MYMFHTRTKKECRLLGQKPIVRGMIRQQLSIEFLTSLPLVGVLFLCAKAYSTQKVGLIDAQTIVITIIVPEAGGGWLLWLRFGVVSF